MIQSKAPSFETATGEQVWNLPQLSESQILQLPPSTPLPYIARACGIGRNAALQMAKTEGAIVHFGRRIPVQKVGRRYMGLRSDLWAALDLIPAQRASN